jgi:hypothetical protein
MPMATHTPTSNGIANSSPPVIANGADLDITTLNVTQLRLLHHFTTVTASTLAHDSASEHVFATHFVRIAFDNPFLLHAVLALGALHLSRLDDPFSPSYAEYVLLADRHHDAALIDFRTRILDIDQTNWKAVLMFAGALFPYTCTASVAATDNLDLAFGNFLSNLALTRRVRPMVAGFYEEMVKSELGVMIPPDVKGVNWEVKEAPAETEYVHSDPFSKLLADLLVSCVS